MKFATTLLLLSVFALTMVGCRAEGEIGDTKAPTPVLR